MKPLCPSEDWEQTQFVSWLESQEYKFTSIPNSTFTRSWSQKAKNKRNGLRPGFPDMAVLLKSGGLMFVELKRVSGGKLSPEQKVWLEELNKAGVPAVVARGSQEAIEKVIAQEAAKSKIDA